MNIKFLKLFIIVLFLAICLTLGISYAILPGLYGIAEEQPIEDTETPDTEQPDEETPGIDTEEPNEDNTDDEEDITYICNVLDYEFNGDTITAYNGTDSNIQLPTSYSIAGTEIVEQTFAVEPEIFDYLMQNFIEYPLTIKDANSQEYLISSEMDIIGNHEIVYPISLEIEKFNYVEGYDYQVTNIGEYAFSNSYSLTSIEIPSSVKSIGNFAFQYCERLTSVTFGDNSQLTSIGNGSFYNCNSITSIEIPSGVTSIGSNAFFQCSSLTSVTFGDDSKLTSIGSYAFSQCSSLTSIEIPSGVTSIDISAFYKCSSLITMTILAITPPELKAVNAIPTSITSIYVPESSVEAYKTAEGWSNFADKIVADIKLSIGDIDTSGDLVEF